MIKNVFVGPGLTAVSGYSSHISNNGPCAGQMRFNTSTQQVEVNDGLNWVIMSQSDPSISLDNEVQDLLAWARMKKKEDEVLKAVLDKHPGIKDLKEKLDMMVALVKEEDKNDANS